MVSADAMEFRELRERLTSPQRDLINALWAHYRDRNEWMPRRMVHQRFGKAAIEAECAALGESVIREQADADAYRLTFLGVLLTDQGEPSERLLIRYLEYVRDRYRTDPTLEWVGSHEVGAALALTAEDSRFLRQLIRLSHWWGGGSAFGGREWTVGVPIDVDELVAESDLTRYVHRHILTHFPSETRPGQGVERSGEFAFVSDSRLRDRLAADWHEAQDVCHVLGWKSCLMLCGGILDSVLLQALAGEEQLRGRHSLDALVATAVARGLLTADSVRIGPALRAYKRLTSPARSARYLLTRADADAALAAVRACLRQLGKK